MPYQVNKSTKVYYINLAIDLTRRYNIENMLQKYEFLNTTRISAIDTRTMENMKIFKSFIDPRAFDTLMNNIKTGKRNFHKELSNGAIGCYLSHLQIYNKMVEENVSHALVFEDDCRVINTATNFWSIMNSVIVPDNTDILLYDAKIYEFNKNNCPTPNIYQVNFFHGTDFYLITLNGAKKLQQYLLPIEIQIDSKLSMLSYGNKICIYGYDGTKFAVSNRFFETNIQLLKCPMCDMFKEINSMKEMVQADYGIKKYFITIIWVSLIVLSLMVLIILLFIMFRDMFS